MITRYAIGWADGQRREAQERADRATARAGLLLFAIVLFLAWLFRA